jgi:hypothetical protein
VLPFALLPLLLCFLGGRGEMNELDRFQSTRIRRETGCFAGAATSGASPVQLNVGLFRLSLSNESVAVRFFETSSTIIIVVLVGDSSILLGDDRFSAVVVGGC